MSYTIVPLCMRTIFLETADKFAPEVSHLAVRVCVRVCLCVCVCVCVCVCAYVARVVKWKTARVVTVGFLCRESLYLPSLLHWNLSGPRGKNKAGAENLHPNQQPVAGSKQYNLNRNTLCCDEQFIRS